MLLFFLRRSQSPLLPRQQKNEPLCKDRTVNLANRVRFIQMERQFL
jgi:hypothetical protein